MLKATLTLDQFNQVASGAGYSPSTIAVLIDIFVNGEAVKDAALKGGVSPSRGYNLARSFENHYNDFLSREGLMPVLTFCNKSA